MASIRGWPERILIVMLFPKTLVESGFYVELVWNREFDWVRYGDWHPTIELAIAMAKAMENSGDGARVKKTRVVDAEGKVCWACGQLVR